MYDMQIEDIDPLERQQALNLFQFLDCAMREVEVQEAAVYTSLNDGINEDRGEADSIQFIKELGGSFVRVTRRSKTVLPGPLEHLPQEQMATFVSVAHSTVSQYIRSRFQLADMHHNVVSRCLKYLSLNVDIQECFRSIKSRYGRSLERDKVASGTLPEGGIDGRRAHEMFLEGWQACRYPWTSFVQDAYPFAHCAWAYWRRHLNAARMDQKEEVDPCDKSQLLQCQSLWYATMIIHYWTRRDHQLLAVEYAAVLLLCRKIPIRMKGMTTPALSFRRIMTAPRYSDETQAKDTDAPHSQPFQYGCDRWESFMQSRDYTLLVGMIEMLTPEFGVNLYGMNMEQLKDSARRIPHWAYPVIILWFCKLIETRLELIGCGEYIEMDSNFLEDDIFDKIAQYRPEIAIHKIMECAERLRVLGTEAASFQRGARLLANSCGFLLPEPEEHERTSEKTGSRSAIIEVMRLLDYECVKGESRGARIASDRVRAVFAEEEEQWLEEALKRAWPQPMTERSGTQGMMPALRERIVIERGPEDDTIIVMKAWQERHGLYLEALSYPVVE